MGRRGGGNEREEERLSTSNLGVLDMATVRECVSLISVGEITNCQLYQHCSSVPWID